MAKLFGTSAAGRLLGVSEGCVRKAVDRFLPEVHRDTSGRRLLSTADLAKLRDHMHKPAEPTAHVAA